MLKKLQCVLDIYLSGRFFFIPVDIEILFSKTIVYLFSHLLIPRDEKQNTCDLCLLGGGATFSPLQIEYSWFVPNLAQIWVTGELYIGDTFGYRRFPSIKFSKIIKNICASVRSLSRRRRKGSPSSLRLGSHFFLSTRCSVESESLCSSWTRRYGN